MTLIVQLAIATVLVGITVVTHLAGLAMLLTVLRRHRQVTRRFVAALYNTAAILTAAFGLFALHAIEIWTWAGTYWWLDVFGDFEHALYFSTSTFVTIGYGDIVLGPDMRILGAIEGANGIILIGWSTAFFFSIVDRLKLLERDFERNR
jgi:voltage-gated potassium channel